MSSQILIRSTRSKGNNKLSSRGLHSPSSLAGNARSKGPSKLSPTRAAKLPKLPANKVNKVYNSGKKDGVAPNPIQSRKNNNPDIICSPEGTAIPSAPSNSESEPCEEEDRASSGDGMSDNSSHEGNPARDAVNGTEDPLDPLDSSDLAVEGDPAKNIVLVLNEIREIKK